MLVDGDDMNEPIADAVRAILDGHVVLSRSLAHAGHYPAIDVLHSVSRLVGEIVSPEVERAGQQLRAAMAVLREKEDLVAIGAYQRGQRPRARRRPLPPRSDRALPAPARLRASDPLQADASLLELAASLARELEHSDDQIPDAEEVLPDEQQSAAAPGGALAGATQLPAIPALGLSI